MTINTFERKFNFHLEPKIWSGIEPDPLIDERFFVYLPQRSANRLHRYCAGEFCDLPSNRESLLEFDKELNNVVLLILGSNDEAFYKESLSEIEFSILERDLIKKEIMKY